MTDTKKRIIESAIKIFNEDLSAPLQKVADNADVTRRTLHRYFKDRNELVAVCKQAIEASCKKAMIAAIESSDDALVQLERMLYAGIDCGAKYSVFYKLHQSKGHNHTHQNKNCADYDHIYNQFEHIIVELQKEGKVNPNMSPEWIQVLHSGIIESTVNARDTTNKSFEEIKDLAWVSYIKAIAP
ncbi:TetR family transcriptional regulator [Antarcticibacterium sp. 1MA-6-2]|uniref:TetR/AcrR family transcriptional regulator n=1 Tax=Antarcticibacterium sp. 1MA-6-2 TaxID=2908210 RepID=UPI001F452DC3|nr:TetR family transcriptional regulator [Antarcticibacterium sp. 1MA-6-2]UJH90949.1 TetR family transcriptional regulator [Antarcticibacterium sp. 1MA-6-2]